MVLFLVIIIATILGLITEGTICDHFRKNSDGMISGAYSCYYS